MRLRTSLLSRLAIILLHGILVTRGFVQPAPGAQAVVTNPPSLPRDEPLAVPVPSVSAPVVTRMPVEGDAVHSAALAATVLVTVKLLHCETPALLSLNKTDSFGDIRTKLEV